MRKQTIKPAVFDGTNRLETESPVTVGEPPSISFACWVRLDSYGGNQDFFGNRAQMALSANSGKLQVFTNHANNTYMGIAGTSLAVDGESYHIVGTYDKDALDGRLKLYIDGKLVAASDQRDGNLAETIYAVAVGALTGGLNQSTGEVYDGLVYTQALTAAQVKRLYNNKLGISATSLKYLGLDQGLICAYALDSENEGLDLSGNENHLSNINNVSFDGQAVDTLHTGIQTRTAVEFDGTNRLETNGDIFGGAELPALGFACWFKISPSSGYRVPLGLRGVLAIGIDSSNRLNSNVSTNDGGFFGVRYDTPLAYDVWYFAVCTYDKDAIGDSLNLYLNGELVDSSNQKRIPTTATNYPVSVGQNAGINQFTGEVYDGLVYTQALTADQVSWLYNKGFGRDPYLLPSNIKQGFLCNYPLDLKSYGKDISGNGYDLTAVNNPTATGLTTQQKISNYQTGL